MISIGGDPANRPPPQRRIRRVFHRDWIRAITGRRAYRVRSNRRRRGRILRRRNYHFLGGDINNMRMSSPDSDPPRVSLWWRILHNIHSPSA